MGIARCVSYLQAKADPDRIVSHPVISNFTEEDQRGVENVEFCTSVALISETVQAT